MSAGKRNRIRWRFKEKGTTETAILEKGREFTGEIVTG